MEILKSRPKHIKESHFVEWKNSAVSQDIIELNVKSLEGDAVYVRLTYGVTRQERNNDGRLSSKHLKLYALAAEGGWHCAGIDLLTFTDLEWGCFKPDKPRKLDGKIIKYESPCCVPTEIFALKVPDNYWQESIKNYQLPAKDNQSFWEWVVNNPLPVIITEGAKKAGCLLTAGYIAISLPGVDNGFREGEPHPQLQALCKIPREFVFCFDQDSKWQTKLHITQAIKKLGKTFESLDSDVSVMVWDSVLDGEGKGIDDFLIKNPGLDKLYEIYDGRLSLEKYLEKHDQVKKLDRSKLLKFLESTYKKRLRFNELFSEVELDGKTLELSGELSYKLITEHMIDAGTEDIINGFLFVAKANSYHPVAKYLEECFYLEPICIDDLANRYFGIDPSDPNSNLYNLFVRKWLIAAVARVVEPGCKFDHALILQGSKHGTGKSSFFQAIGGDWHDSSAGANIENTKTLMIFHRCWIQEWDEFDRVTSKSDAEVLKSFITNRADRFVRPYGRGVINHPRRFVIAGTVNKPNFLVDETGNRRCLIIPIPLGWRIPNEELVKPERDRVMGTAVRAYLEGKKQNKNAWALTPQQEEATNEASLRFMTDDSWQDEIEYFLDGRDRVTIDFILEKLFHFELKERERKYQMRVARALTLLGWTNNGKKETDPITRKRERFWYPPMKPIL